MIHFEVPEIVPSAFIVATADPHVDPAAFDRIEPPLGPVVRDLLGTPLLEISTYPAHEVELTELIAGSAWVRPEEQPLLETVTHHVVVASHGPPTAQPQYAQAARAAARVVAAASDGIVYDVGSHQTLPSEFRATPERQEFCLGDDWLAVFIAGDSDDTVEVATVGLCRFGLLDLVANGVPTEHCFGGIMLLRALAVGLLERQWRGLVQDPGDRTLRVERDLWVEVRDAWRYWGVSPPPVTDRIRVGLGMSSDVFDRTPAILTVGPPSATQARNWWRRVVTPAMPNLTEAPDQAAA
jgi:hypothetical protein